MSDVLLNTQLRQMSRVNNVRVRCGWGTRVVDAGGVALLLRGVFSLVDGLGGVLAGPWGFGVGESRETARIINVSGMNDDELIDYVVSTYDLEYPESGYYKTLFRGEVITEDGWGQQDFMEFMFRLGATIMGSSVALDADEYQLLPSESMWCRSRELVEGLARIFRPDYVSLLDRDLDVLKDEYFRVCGSGGAAVAVVGVCVVFV